MTLQCVKVYSGKSIFSNYNEKGNVKNDAILNTKPFLCDSCEESFAKDSKLKLYIKGMQGRKKPFSCPMCGSQFYFSTRLKDHIEKKHKSQDFTVSEVRKNTLLEFMKALSHSYVIRGRNHLPKIPN